LFEETAGDRESRFGVFGGGLVEDTAYRLYLIIKEGYPGALGTTPPKDPRYRRVLLEGAVPLKEAQ